MKPSGANHTRLLSVIANHTRLLEPHLFSPTQPHGACWGTALVRVILGRRLQEELGGMRAPYLVSCKSRAGRLADAMGHFKTNLVRAVLHLVLQPCGLRHRVPWALPRGMGRNPKPVQAVVDANPAIFEYRDYILKTHCVTPAVL